MARAEGRSDSFHLCCWQKPARMDMGKVSFGLITGLSRIGRRIGFSSFQFCLASYPPPPGKLLRNLSFHTSLCIVHPCRTPSYGTHGLGEPRQLLRCCAISHLSGKASITWLVVWQPGTAWVSRRPLPRRAGLTGRASACLLKC